MLYGCDLVMRFIHNKSLLCCALLYICFTCIDGYNLDTKFPIFFKGSSDDYFGFSVALHRNRVGPIALVGAPRANSSLLTELHQPGVLFRCGISFARETQSCEEVLLDRYGNTHTHRENNLSYSDKKDNMWLGVSLDVQQNTTQNDIVICGHLWKNQFYSQHYLANGVCYVINSDLDPKSVKKLLPFVDKSKQSLTNPGIYYYAFGQVGASAAYSEDGKQLLLGAPGFYDWSGTVLSYFVDSRRGYNNSVIPELPTDKSIQEESYVGYSITSGKFFESNETYIAVGAPRDGNSHGRVYIFKALRPTTSNLFVHQKKEGLQLGEYFGASVLALNLNNDLYTDLLVGAPFASSESGGDEGKVYVYISNGMGLQIFTQLLGENKPNARFGTAIANVGDLNQDGFNDVAIGAPYEDRNGAVYIYHGSRQGIKTQYIQRIAAGDIKPSLSGFGIQISRGLDIDSNQFPDILIGAYASSEAVLFRTKPIIQVSSKLSFSPQQINKNITLCDYEGQSVSCVNVTSCLNYVGKHVQLSLEFVSRISLEHISETNAISPRGFFLQDGRITSTVSRQISLVIGIDNCQTDTLYIYPNIKDMITPIPIFYNCELTERKDKDSKFCKTCPIIDHASSSNITKPISFQTGCGRNDKCLADLVVQAQIRDNPKNNPMIIGENENLILDIEVSNIGEPAYLSELLIHLPAETQLISISQDSCSQLNDEQSRGSNASLICELGNPLLRDQTEKIQIKIDISKVSGDRKVLNLFLEASTGSNEVAPADNSLTIPISFKSIADISIIGTPAHEQIPYNEDVDESSFISISHTYFVMNHGPSPLQIIDIYIYVPISLPGKEGSVNFLAFTNLEADSGKPQTIAAKCNDTGIVLKPASTETKKTRGESFGELDLIEKGREINETTESKENSSNPDATTRSKKSIERAQSSKKKQDITINCQTAQCLAIHCSAAPFIDNRKFARITVSAEINMTILNNALDPWYQIEFITGGEIIIRDGERGIQPKNHHPDSTTVKTVIVHPGPPPSEEVEKWIIFVSIGVGIFLLVIILIALIKIGFFRRQQKEKIRQMMTQPSEKENDPCLIDDSETCDGKALNEN